MEAARDAFLKANDSHSLAKLLLELPNKKFKRDRGAEDIAGPWLLGDDHDVLMVIHQMTEDLS